MCDTFEGQGQHRVHGGTGNEEYIVQCDVDPLGNNKTDRPDTYGLHRRTAHTMYSMRSNWPQLIEVRFTVADVYGSPSIKKERGERWINGSGVTVISPCKY